MKNLTYLRYNRVNDLKLNFHVQMIPLFNVLNFSPKMRSGISNIFISVLFPQKSFILVLFSFRLFLWSHGYKSDELSSRGSSLSFQCFIFLRVCLFPYSCSRGFVRFRLFSAKVSYSFLLEVLIYMLGTFPGSSDHHCSISKHSSIVCSRITR